MHNLEIDERIALIVFLSTIHNETKDGPGELKSNCKLFKQSLYPQHFLLPKGFSNRVHISSIGKIKWKNFFTIFEVKTRNLCPKTHFKK